MKSRFNLQFFGGGGGTEQYAKRDPEPEELKNLRMGLYGKIAPGLQTFSTDNWENAQNITNQAMQQQSSLLGQIPNTLTQNNSLANEIANIARTGNIPSTLADNMNARVNQDLKSSMGSMINNLGKRGVLNSSVTTAGMNQLSKAAADAFNNNYMTAYQAVLGGLGQGMQGMQNNTASLLSALGAVGSVPSQSYEALGAQLTPAFNLWKNWQSSYDNREDYDTVVREGK